MTADELHAMPDDALKKLSLKKNKKGNATSDALRAQAEIVRRNNGCYIGCGHTKNRWSLSDEFHGKWQKKFK